MTRFLVSFLEFFLSVLISVLAVFVSYRVFSKANPDFDQEEEIKKGNVAVGILLAAIMYAAGTMVQKGLFPVLNLVKFYLYAPSRQTLTQWQLPLLALGHFVMVFGLTVATISFSLRLYGRLTSTIEEGKELLKGNVAVGVVLASVVLMVSIYVGDGIGSLARALLPQVTLGKIQVLK